MSLRVLIANYCMDGFTGTELFTRDLALELKRLGHSPAVYTSSMGGASEEIIASEIPVVTSLRQIEFHPDIVHGNHRFETLAAIRRYPDTPAIYICHDHLDWLSAPPIHSHIQKYFGVSNLCISRILKSGISGNKTGRVHNFVDLNRFKPRPPLPAKPIRALVFSNYATNDSYLPVIAASCKHVGLELDAIGKGAGNLVERPEEILGNYDIVFAKAKAAMEAIATGNAVVLCDFGGVGPMVRSDDFERLRDLNFGFQALTEPHTQEHLVRQIERYDPADSEKVRDMLRSCGGLETAVGGIIKLYDQAISEFSPDRRTSTRISDTSAIVELIRVPLAYKALKLWKSIPPKRRRALVSNSGFRFVEVGIRRVLTGRSKREV